MTDTTEADEWACERHDIKRLPTGYDRCPYCEEERRIEDMKAEYAQRHAPRWVDDPAPTSSYDAW